MSLTKRIGHFLSGLRIWRLRAEVADMTNLLAEVNSRVIQLQFQVNEVAGLAQQHAQGFREQLLTLRYHTWKRPVEVVHPVAVIKEVPTLAEQKRRLRRIVPHAYDKWSPLLSVNQAAYSGMPTDSCSVPGHPTATLFRFFLAPYLTGRVLDIGCGPQPIPTYLEDHPVDAIYGIDPLSEPEDHLFHFVKGFAEFLPWEDNQFELVVAATSLDHVLLLDKVLEEIRRVISKDGFFVSWDGFIPGSKPYNPYQEVIDRVDDYHMFHFDRPNFLSAVRPYFTVFEEFAVDAQSNFTVLRPN